jgi:signal transduction histidine kinase/ligand-binding sensor domain-containing protein
MRLAERFHTRFRVWAICALGAGFLLPGSVCAADTSHVVVPLAANTPYRLRLTQFEHRAYLSRDGAPSSAQAIAQTPDGFLWFGTPNGLMRFDGVRFDASFTRLLPAISVSSLHPEANGDLWIGYTFGGISLLHDGKVTNVPPSALPGGSVLGFVRTDDHALWIATTRGVARQNGSQWKSIGAKEGYTGHAPQWLGIVKGTIYLFDLDTAYTLDPRAHHFVQVDFQQAKHALLGLPASVAWSAHKDPYWASLRDPSGALWFTREDQEGITRYRWSGDSQTPSSEEQFGRRDGLTGQYALLYFMDRESNIWIATEGGVDRFTVSKFTPVVFPNEMSNLILTPDTKGGVLVASLRENVFYLGADNDPVRIAGFGPGGDCSTVDHQGAVWVAAAVDLEVYDGKSTTHVSPPPGTMIEEHGSRTLQYCQGMAEDADGNIWISFVKIGVFRWSKGIWQINGGLTSLPSGPSIRVTRGDLGQIWLTYPNNRIAMVDHDRVTLYDHTNGLAIGNVLAIYPHRRHVWAAGDQGMAYLAPGGKFVTFKGAGGNPLQAISGIVETPSGELWLNSPEGVYRIASPEVAKLLEQPGYEPSFELLAQDDGLYGSPMTLRPGPTLIASTDGRIWVTTKQNLSWIDPAHIRRNKVTPVAVIENLSSGSNSFPIHGPATLPALTRIMRIDYTAAMLSMPERARFRYRLKGVDEDWQDAGNRRSAFYTNLSPGHYRFEVTAYNEDGFASASPTALDIDLEPAFFQTKWFKALCVCIALLILWLLYMLRMALVERRYRLLFNERIAERERIARNMHDTLLQGVQGMLMQIAMLSQSPNLVEPDRQKAVRIEGNLRQILVEGRDSISTLRQSDLHQEDLITRLLEVGNHRTNQSATRFSLKVRGETRSLRPDIIEEIVAIACEAIINAFNHAQAEWILAVIDYTRQALILSITDNGIGLSEKLTKDRQKEGHWGIAGMRERALKLGGQLSIMSNTGAGTIVEVTVPKRNAYIHAKDRKWRWLNHGRQRSDNSVHS